VSDRQYNVGLEYQFSNFGDVVGQVRDKFSDGALAGNHEPDHPVKHSVYVVRIGKHVYIKRLKYDIMAEGYEVISDNKEEHDSFIVNEEKLNEFAVIGKVVTTVMKVVI